MRYNSTSPYLKIKDQGRGIYDGNKERKEGGGRLGMPVP
jgi:hypothetical protein